MSTDLLQADTWVPFQELSKDDVARAALLVYSTSLLTGTFVPLAIMKSVMDETSRREMLKEQKEQLREKLKEQKEERKEQVRLAERQADRAERLAERQADRFLAVVVLVAAACLAVYLKN